MDVYDIDSDTAFTGKATQHNSPMYMNVCHDPCVSFSSVVFECLRYLSHFPKQLLSTVFQLHFSTIRYAITSVYIMQTVLVQSE